jgi:hypothetical protein
MIIFGLVPVPLDCGRARCVQVRIQQVQRLPDRLTAHLGGVTRSQ